jgi:hypothetical protein
MEDSKEVLFELLVGIIFFCILETVILLFITDNFLFGLGGVLVGNLTSVIFILHMYKTIEKALDMSEDNAVKYTRKKALIRYIIVGAVMLIVFVLNRYLSVVMTFVGIMSVKFSAYAQPLTHIVIKKIKDKRKVKS